jgi:hypothetical protein
LVGQAETQAGSEPAAVRSGQRSHLIAFLPTGSALTPPKGQTITHIQQPMHLLASEVTFPVKESRAIAPVGQAATQAGSSQCWQRLG